MRTRVIIAIFVLFLPTSAASLNFLSARTEQKFPYQTPWQCAATPLKRTRTPEGNFVSHCEEMAPTVRHWKLARTRSHTQSVNSASLRLGTLQHGAVSEVGETFTYGTTRTQTLRLPPKTWLNSVRAQRERHHSALAWKWVAWLLSNLTESSVSLNYVSVTTCHQTSTKCSRTAK